METLVDALAVVGRQRSHLHQGIDEQPEGLVGRDASGRRVWLVEVATLFEIRQDVADACRGKVEPVLFGEGAAADRLSGRYEFRHGGVQNASRAMMQIAHPASSG